MRNYKKERENYHGKPEQMIRNAARKRARRQMEKEGKAKAGDGKDVHHKDNDPLNNDKKNLSLVTQHYNRKEPRIREKKLKQALRKEVFTGVPGMTAVVHNGEIVAKGSKSAMTKKFKELKKKYPKDAGRAGKLKLVSAPGSKYKVGGVWKEKNIKEDAAAAADLKAKQAAEVDALKDKQEGEVEALKAKHEREGERQKKQDEAEGEAEKARDAREEVEEGKKRFKQMDNVGKAKYTINFHDGKSKHKDGSDFFDLRIFKNKPSLEKFKKDLLKKGYKEEEVDEANAISMSNPNAKRMIGLMQKYFNTKDKDKKAALLKDINKYQKMFGLKVSEDMGTVTGPHIAGTGDDSSTVVVKKKKKKVYRRESLKKRVLDNVLAIQQKV